MLIKRAGFELAPDAAEHPLPPRDRRLGERSHRPQGKLISRDDYERRLPEWMPSASDRAFVNSLMQRVVEPGKMAGWIAPPDRGINNLPVEYEYVRLQ